MASAAITRRVLALRDLITAAAVHRLGRRRLLDENIGDVGQLGHVLGQCRPGGSGCRARTATALPGLSRVSAQSKEPPFKISLAQWSLHKTIFAGKLDNRDFAKAAKEDYGIDAIEAAIARLSSGRGKIAELSAELGFSAQSNFTRFFLNQVGVPPSEYRRAASRPDPEDLPEPKTGD